MAITIPIPDELERQLRAESPDLDATAKEALLVELYRQGKLPHKQLGQLLGLDRWGTEALLNKHHVTEDLPTLDEIREQVQASRNLRKQG